MAVGQSLTGWLDRSFYPGAVRNWDDLRFAELVRSRLSVDFRILDFGAGRGKTDVLDFRGSASEIVGVDVDSDILENPYLHEKHVVDPQAPLPLEDGSLDLIYSCNVLEHVQEPAATFQEIERVLKPGGIFLAKTTNRRHYVPLAASLTPLWFHKRFNRLRGRDDSDTFPTVYQCNSRGQIKSAIAGTGLELVSIDFWEWRPEYLRINPVTYLTGIIYEKLVNSCRLFEPCRAVMVVELKKV